MRDSFAELRDIENPDTKELQAFVTAVMRFLNNVVHSDEFAFLWEVDRSLRWTAQEEFETNVSASGSALISKIPHIDRSALADHGLNGPPLRFKFRVLDAIARSWNKLPPRLGIPVWLKRMFEAIDTTLDSLIQAAGGTGAVLKEFKDALSCLITPTE
jgi:hypothetical protein